ncbi:Piso0_000949 [Millerozyma farinosa CBS 7064]|uniref:Piso0_000949 protein n=1 Tax=Pichia sorbitophila (strain ATCC MYA-4447 / BCRC 22081 / CBS 7064 / NBRC 10061 / NRRL Y-12695) TaxID=559304 RepID=G8YQH9_PICSO|nr:Piso0_000949 [Millerozyma farinosa CBS 7064]
MAIALSEDGEERSETTLNGSRILDLSKKVLNGPRVYNVPILNGIIISVLGVFLARLTTKYTELYMKNSLITIMVTNLVLYGISESLAQSLLCFNRRAPVFAIYIRDPSRNRPEDIEDVQVERTYRDADSDEEGLENFIGFLQSNNSDPINFTPIGTQNHAGLAFVPQLTYFNFSRLAGFMCWGFVMSFAQCWWYKFLQIYSADPKFIEVLRKVLTDQLVYSPISLLCFYTYGTIVLESGTWEDAKVKLARLFLKTLLINYSVWFPVQFFNFLLVPRNFQVPFSSSISVLWNCFLSIKNSSS